jgi:outer membrane protein TolC
VLAFVEGRNPELRAMSLEVDAAQQRLRGAGALADPILQMELRDIPFSEPTLSPANAGSTRYSLRQMYPLGDKRELRRGIAEAEANVAGAKRSAVIAETRMRAKVAFSQYWYTAQAQRVTEGLRTLMADLEQIARARYSSGLTPQQDVIKAQTELTSLRTELVMLASERRQAAARLNGVMARPADAPLAEPRELRALPERALDFAALTRSAGERSPVLAVNTAQIAAAERNAKLMRASRVPDLGVGLAVIQQGTRLTDYEVMLELNIPWQTDIIRANVNEAQAMSDAAAARREATATQLQSDLGQNWAALDALREQGDIVRSTLLPQVQLTLESALASYQTGRVDFPTLLDAQRQIRRTRLDLLKIELEQQMRLAEIERIVGEDL